MILRSGLFVIVCAARTGSSMLVNYLQSHPDITAHMEIYHPKRAEGFFGSYRSRIASEPGYQDALTALRASRPGEFLYKVVFDAQGRKAAGFKIKYDELLLTQFARTRDALATDADVRVIHLKRRNLFRRHLSHELAAKVTHVTMVKAGERRPEFAPITLNVAAAMDDIRQTRRMEAFVDKLFAGHSIHRVFYEDLISEMAAAELEKIQRFIGVEPTALRTVHQRLSDDDLAPSIANFGEVKAAFAQTPFAEMLEN